MAYTNGRLPGIDRIISTEPPERLYHYTSPAGLIGIAKNKVLWASHVKYLNDSKELDLAVDAAKYQLSLYMDPAEDGGHFSEKEKELFKYISDHAGRASTGIYVASLTQERDLLSQWRAYCPDAGGYSIGFSSEQLISMAKYQSFFLSPCVYGNGNSLVVEIIHHHLNIFRQQMKDRELDSKEIKHIGVECARDISRFGAILKHKSFEEEREWRLISSPRAVNHPSIMHRPGKAGIIPYLDFKLVNKSCPDLARKGTSGSLTVVIGPTRNNYTYPVQSLGRAHFPEGWGFIQSQSSYRGA
jgi:hypothetical protein